MSNQDAAFWARTRRARDKLAQQLLGHPAVSLIDIGYPIEQGQVQTNQIVLRVHVHASWAAARAEDRPIIPAQVDGIPVVVLPGDYQIETDAADPE
jgi:hypothetical protein